MESASTVSQDVEVVSDTLSETMEHLSINPTAIPPPDPLPLAVSPPQQRTLGTQGRANTSFKPTSIGTARRISAAKSTSSHPKSPPTPHKLMNIANQSIVPAALEKETVQQTTIETVAQIPHPQPSIALTQVTNDNLPINATTIAEEYFRLELKKHETSNSSTSDTIVIVNDACYGHRFSRRKTAKGQLALIVERPERIQAGILGLSCAYVRLGEHYAGGKHEPCLRGQDTSALPFVIRRTTRSVPLSSPAVVNVHGTKWMQELATMCNLAESRLVSNQGELARSVSLDGEHTKPEFHAGDLYLCPESLGAFEGALGGVFDGVDAVFRKNALGGASACKKAFVCIRPPGHHCSADMPSGFCWLNNVHIGIEYAAQAHGLTHAAIIDFDLHHGDGSQNITWERNDKALSLPKNIPAAKRTSIGYFSLHDINSYPCEYGDIEKVQNASLCIENAHGQSIWNVHLQPWKTEAEFWELYNDRYVVLLEKAKSFLQAQTQRIRTASSSGTPKSAIFISAGFDASEWESEGMQRHKVNVPTCFYARFTSDINRMAEAEGTSAGGRVISVLEGGYSDRALMSGVLSHLTGLVGRSMNMMTNSSTSMDIKTLPMSPKAWWDSETLTYLENMVKPLAGQTAAKKSRLSELSSVTASTKSSLAKVVNPAKLHRAHVTDCAPIVVDWATAAHELSKLLIPKDRQIHSCRHDELVERRVKKDRQSVMTLPSEKTVNDYVQTRGRRPKSSEHLPTKLDTIITLPVRAVPQTDVMSTNPSGLMDVGDVTEMAQNPVTEGIASLPPDQPIKIKSQSTRAVTKTKSPSSDRLPRPSKPVVPISKVHRTRRTSMLPPDLIRSSDVATNHASHDTNPDSKATSNTGSMIVRVDPVFSQVEAQSKDSEIKTSTMASSEAQSKDNEIEKLTIGIKRITLKLPPKDLSKPSKTPPTATTTSMGDSQGVPEGKLRKVSTANKHAPRNVKRTSMSIYSLLNTTPTSSDSVGTSTVKATPQTSTNSEPNQHEKLVKETLGLENAEVFVRPPTVSRITAAQPIIYQHVPQTKGTMTLATRAKVEHESRTQPELTIQEEDINNVQAQDIMPSFTIGENTKVVSTNTFENFIRYIPAGGNENFQHNYTQTKPADLTWLPPNSKTPPHSPTKHKNWPLPVFTASSHIPFEKPTVHGTSGTQHPHVEEATTQDAAKELPPSRSQDVYVDDT